MTMDVERLERLADEGYADAQEMLTRNRRRRGLCGGIEEQEDSRDGFYPDAGARQDGNGTSDSGLRRCPGREVGRPGSADGKASAVGSLRVRTGDPLF